MAGDGTRVGEREGAGVVVVGVEPHGGGQTLSKASLQAFAHAAVLARLQGARLVSVWVRPHLAIGETFADTVETLERERDAQEAAFGWTVEKAGAEAGVAPVAPVIRDGDAFEELTTVADELEAEAVVVGASEHRLGSVAARLIRDARWPVTVVPPRRPGA